MILNKGLNIKLILVNLYEKHLKIRIMKLILLIVLYLNLKTKGNSKNKNIISKLKIFKTN